MGDAGFSSKTCFGLLVTFVKLRLSSTIFPNIGNIRFYYRTKGVWIDSILFFGWIYEYVLYNQWGCWIKNPYLFLDKGNKYIERDTQTRTRRERLINTWCSTRMHDNFLFKGAIRRCWYFVDYFLCPWKLLLLHLKSIWRTNL